MNCEQTTEYFSSYIEGDLDAGIRLNVEQHLEDCQECKLVLDGLMGVFTTLENADLNVEVPGQFHDNVMRRLRVQQLEAQRTPAGWFASLERPWKAAAIGLAAVSTMFVVWSLGPLGSGSVAGFGRAPWLASSRQAPPPILRITGTTAGFRQAGVPDTLVVSMTTSRTGNSGVYVRTSPGIAFASQPAIDPAGEATAWTGVAKAGEAVQIPLQLTAAEPGNIHEVTIRSQQGQTSSMTTILLPVQTPRAPGSRLDWQMPQQSTARKVLASLSAFTGTPVSIPTDALDQPVSINAAGAEPDDILDAIAVAARLKLDRQTGCCNLYR